MNRHLDRLKSSIGLAAAVVCACCTTADAHAQVNVAAPAGQGQAFNMVSSPRGPVPYLATANGLQVTMPVSRTTGATYSRQSGFQLSVDFNWPGPYGYRPVTFKLTSQKPVVADQKIDVEFKAGDWSPPRGEAITAKKSFVFPAGATTASVTVAVPRLQEWQMGTWRVAVDGASDDYLAVDDMYFNSMGIAQTGIGAIGLGLSGEQESNINSVLQAAANGVGVSVRVLQPADFPTNWLDYSTLDVAVMPAKDFVDFAQSHPRQATALLRWVRAGGSLWLLEAGQRWRRTAAIEQAMSWTKSDAAEDEGISDKDFIKRGWRFAPTGERSLEPSQGALVLSGFDTGQDDKWSDLVEAVSSAVRSSSAPWFAVRGHGLGAVAAFRGSVRIRGTDPLTDQFYNTLSQTLLGPRMTWASRHGNQPDTSNDEFNNLLIPGVGVAPVGQFQFLITLFAVIIGPLNYWLLKGKNKLPLLLATVPVAAAVTTALLFAYGVLVDGFDVLARTRTLTLLDQRAGEAVAWGRLSYYAGIAPQEGLALPTDQAMYPITPAWASTSYGRSTNAPRVMAWDDQQRLTRGWLASRTPTQYNAVAARATSRRLELRTTNDGLRIVNRLGVEVTHVGVEDHDGKFYWCENLADGAGKVVPATGLDTLTMGIRGQFTDNIPESPGGDDYRYQQNYGRQWSQSLMEGRLEAINDPAITSWGPGKYIAFTKRPVELHLGLDEVAEELSFNVIEGTW